MRALPRSLLTGLSICLVSSSLAQNPLIRNQYSADPTARVFGDKVYVYPSHDILATPGKGRVGWFCMEDYHVFSSADLTDWTDHGMIVSQYNVPWADSTAYSMWAPDCIFRNNKYYFYFPTKPKDTLKYGRGFTIGVAISDKPYGPFTPQPEPIKNVRGIDPNVFIDKDGQAYLYWAQGNIYGAKLKENMLELASEPVVLTELPDKGLKEGPFLFERNGIYYLTYPHVGNKTERLEYAIGNTPLGPFKVTGVIMDESPTGCWTNHHSFIYFKNQWYLFYHHNDYSPKFDKARSIRADSLFFNSDNTIRKVIPTLRGIGVTEANTPIQMDRYSKVSDGVEIAFIDTTNRFKGWKIIFNNANEWVQYNSVDFKKPKATVHLRVRAPAGGTLQVRLNGEGGDLITEFNIPSTNEWKDVEKKVTNLKTGIQNLAMVSTSNTPIEVDWITFK